MSHKEPTSTARTESRASKHNKLGNIIIPIHIQQLIRLEPIRGIESRWTVRHVITIQYYFVGKLGYLRIMPLLCD